MVYFEYRHAYLSFKASLRSISKFFRKVLPLSKEPPRAQIYSGNLELSKTKNDVFVLDLTNIEQTPNDFNLPFEATSKKKLKQKIHAKNASNAKKSKKEAHSRRKSKSTKKDRSTTLAMEDS